MESLEALQSSGLSAIQSAETLEALEALRVGLLGKQGTLTQHLKAMARATPEKKRDEGRRLNGIKQTLIRAIADKTAVLEAAALAERLRSETVDVTLPGRSSGAGSLHPITHVQKRVTHIFHQMGFSVAEGPEIEDEYHNFEALNMPAHHPARGMQDTFYLGSSRLLRTHTSPVQVRAMESDGVPMRLISLGRVYRRDSDQTHTPMFHQLEGLVVDVGCSFIELKGVVEAFLSEFFDRRVTLRFRPTYFPFTEPSAEVDLYNEATGDWMEVLGCGLVHPSVLTNVGVDPEVHSGYAFGVGLDRLAMLYYQVPDLRVLFENDLRLLKQF